MPDKLLDISPEALANATDEQLASIIRLTVKALNSLISYAIQRDIAIELKLAHLSCNTKPYKTVTIQRITKPL